MLHEIGTGALRATVDSFGAQLTSLSLDGVEYLWDAGDPWHYSAPVLFPIISGLPDSTLVHRGVGYPIPSHGFARRSEWRHLGEGRFELAASPETRAQYPFEFRLELQFTVDERLTVAHTVTNEGDEPLPYLLGGHPAFRWPLPGAALDSPHTVSWESGGATMRQAVQGLRAGRIPSPAVAGHVVLDRAQFAEDAMLFDDITPRRVSYTAPDAATITLEYEDFSRLGIWSKPEHAAFVCLEPWTGYPAPQGFDGEITELPEITLLPSGESRSYRYSVTIEGE